MFVAANLNNALKNRLLAALPAAEFRRVASKLKSVSLKLGEVLYESGDELCLLSDDRDCLFALYYAEWRHH